MTVTCAIFVEGENDKLFLGAFLNRIGLSNFQLEVIGGGISKLSAAQHRIQRSYDAGKRIAIILDADADISGRRDEIEVEKARLNLPVNYWFLFPDNVRSGNLETLLEKIATERHKRIHDCFTEYQKCLQGICQNYNMPDSKARIFSYCEAVANGPKEKDRNYSDRRHWNLEAPDLDALKEFLHKCAGTKPA